MILQALTRYYQTLADRGEISPPGWSEVRIAYALCIREDGTLEQVISTQTEQKKGSKTVIAPQAMELPAPVKRSSGIAANFLWDSSTYLLGVDNKGKPQRALDCFKAAKELHENLLSQVSTPAARRFWPFSRPGSRNRQSPIQPLPIAWMKSYPASIWYSDSMEPISNRIL